MEENESKIFPNWDKVDKTKTCPACGNTKIIKRQNGFTRQNFRKLLVPKKTADEAIITFLLIALIMMGMFYKFEIQQSVDLINDFYNNTEEYCEGYYQRYESSELIIPYIDILNKSSYSNFNKS